jgi:hypothetical protein
LLPVCDNFADYIVPSLEREILSDIYVLKGWESLLALIEALVAKWHFANCHLLRMPRSYIAQLL